MTPAPSATRSWTAAALWAAGCGLLFSVVYNACNHLAAHRKDVTTWFFAWELQLPFLPWMIVPYWSIDLLYLIAFFVAPTRDELGRLGRRIILCTLAAGVVFLAMPLTLGFPRPPVTGWPEPWFAALRSFDLPHNLFPSLHVALRTILAAFYARHVPARWRWLSHAWFSLIGFSTIFTYQHQVIDVLGGFLLGAWCLWTFPEPGTPAEPARNATAARRYFVGAAVCAALTWEFWRPGILWLWPGGALAVLGAANAGRGAAVFRKRDGRVPFGTRVALAPVLLGQWASWWHYSRQSDPWNEVVPGVWIGRHLTEREAVQAVRSGVTAVLDLTAEFSETRAFRQVAYLNLPVLDLTAPSRDQLEQAAAFIEPHRRTGIVYIHCKAGYSRTAGAVGAWLLRSGTDATPDDAMRRLRAVRPRVVIRPEIEQALRAFASP